MDSTFVSIDDADALLALTGGRGFHALDLQLLDQGPRQPLVFHGNGLHVPGIKLTTEVEAFDIGRRQPAGPK